MTLINRLKELGITLPEVAKPVAAYVPAVRSGNLVYVSGQLPFANGSLLAMGAVPEFCSVESAQAAARQCLLNGIAAAASVAGGPDNLGRLIQVSGFVQSAQGFAQQPAVINGASELALEIFGDAGKHARAAVGVSSLPLNASVEIAFIFEVK